VGHAWQLRSVVSLPAPATKVPAAQVVQSAQLEAFVVFAQVPQEQPEQVRSVVASPSLAMKSPAMQSVLSMQAVAALPSSSNVPGAQATWGLVSPAQKVPASQGTQVAGVLEVAGDVCRVPAGQASGSRQTEAFVVVLMSPLGHAAHTRSLVKVPLVFTYCPGLQSENA
jgi:hypothetical protein